MEGAQRRRRPTGGGEQPGKRDRNQVGRLRGEGTVVSGIGWLIILGSGLTGLVFCRAAHVESVARKRALIEQTLDYERMRRGSGG
jgi:hypothetical protein